MREILVRFARFASMGAIGTAAHYIVLTLLVTGMRTDPVIASTYGFIVGALVNYCLNYRYTFRSSKPHLEAIVKFFSVASLGLLINGLLMGLLTARLTVYYLAAQVVATLTVLIWNFAANTLWTFSEPRRGRKS